MIDSYRIDAIATLNILQTLLQAVVGSHSHLESNPAGVGDHRQALWATPHLWPPGSHQVGYYSTSCSGSVPLQLSLLTIKYREIMGSEKASEPQQKEL